MALYPFRDPNTGGIIHIDGGPPPGDRVRAREAFATRFGQAGNIVEGAVVASSSDLPPGTAFVNTQGQVTFATRPTGADVVPPAPEPPPPVPGAPGALAGQPIEQASARGAFLAFLNERGGTGVDQFGTQQPTFARQFAEKQFDPAFNIFRARGALAGLDFSEDDQARAQAFQNFLPTLGGLPTRNQLTSSFSDLLGAGPGTPGVTPFTQVALNPQNLTEARTVGDLANSILAGSISPLLYTSFGSAFRQTPDLFADFLARPELAAGQNFGQFTRGRLGLGSLGVQPGSGF